MVIIHILTEHKMSNYCLYKLGPKKFIDLKERLEFWKNLNLEKGIFSKKIVNRKELPFLGMERIELAWLENYSAEWNYSYDDRWTTFNTAALSISHARWNNKYYNIFIEYGVYH